MAGQENVEHRRANRRDHHEEESAAPAAKEDDSALDSDVDAILDEIDGVLESNAEDFVKSFVQKGGQ